MINSIMLRLSSTWWYVTGWTRSIIYFIQRGRRGWSERDVWDLESYLAGVIEGSVEHLRQTTHSYPGLSLTGQEITEQEWDETLTAISEGFGLMARDEDLMDGDRIVTTVERRKEYKKAMRLLAKNFPSLWT